MRKIIRPTYPKEFSIGLILLIFVIACFLSHQVFVVPIHDLKDNQSVYLGMFLVSFALIIMVLIMWEEILFPIKLKEIPGGILFQNRRSKLRIQVIMYCCIPLLLGYVYLVHEIRHFRFILWTFVCMAPPVIEKIISGINNYNDFLKLTDTRIEYKNNRKEGNFSIKDVQQIEIIAEDKMIIKKIQLLFTNSASVVIDLDEMELDEYYNSIYTFITTHYKALVKQA